MDLGTAIRALRKALKLKKNELADRAGLSNAALYNIEHNRSFPSKDTIDKICQAMNVSVACLMVFCITEDDVPEEKRLAFRYLITPLKTLLLQDNIEGTDADLRCCDCVHHYEQTFWCALHKCHAGDLLEICNDFKRR